MKLCHVRHFLVTLGLALFCAAFWLLLAWAVL